MLISSKQARDSARMYAVAGGQAGPPFVWKKELRELVSFKFFNLIWWPLFRFRQRYFTHNSFFRSCKRLPGFKDLWETIQKGSFAYNCLFLKIKPYHQGSSATDLADVTTLTLFFGDQFIDGVCKAAGKDRMRFLLNSDPSRFYLRKRLRDGRVRLEYRFHLTRLLPAAIMNQVDPKYSISYSRFYCLLEHFLQDMNRYIAVMELPRAQRAADKILDVCNACLDSYLHDVNSDLVDKSIRDVSTVLHFHETKTRYMQEKLLELRCLLAGREHMMNDLQTEGWLDIMRVVQIYDDLQDVVEDDGFQDNLVISTACHKFPAEWDWLRSQKNSLHHSKDRALTLSLHMPQTVRFCLQLASDRMRSMNWEQQKIMNYLLFKNWFVGREDLKTLYAAPGHRDFLTQAYLQLKDSMPATDEEGIKSHLLTSCFHLRSARKIIKNKLGLSIYYQLRFNLLNIPCGRKAQLFDKVAGYSVERMRRSMFVFLRSVFFLMMASLADPFQYNQAIFI